jgi:isopenicillin-N N-acyltransferase-like protein
MAPQWGRTVNAQTDEELVYPVVDVDGTPHEMGLQHGRDMARRIRTTVKTLREAYPTSYDAAWPAFAPTLSYCRVACPGLVREMEGIAEGAGLPFRDIWMINAHLDLAIWEQQQQQQQQQPHPPATPSPELPGCSSHAVDAGGGIVALGWNGDDLSAWMECCIVLRGRPSAGRPFACVCWAGTIGRPGTSHTVAVGANSVPANGWRADGLLYNMVCRLMLQCPDTAAAVEVLDDHPTCSAMNYLLADSDGNIADVETDGRTPRTTRPAQGQRWLAHTNHYEHSDHRALNATKDPVSLEDSEARVAAARSMYTTHPPQGTASLFETLGTAPIYRERSDARPPHTAPSETVVCFAVHMEGGEATLHVVRGDPVTAPRLAVRLPSVLAPLPTSLNEFAALGGNAEPKELTPSQVDDFRRDGYLHLRGFYSPQEVSERETASFFTHSNENDDSAKTGSGQK